MKNQKILTVAALAGLAVGGLSVSAAAAQSHGDDSSSTTVESVETADNTEATNAEDIVLMQDTEASESTEDQADGHRGGCDLEEAAAAIGIDEAELEAAIDSGDTIADVAEANGVAVDVVVDAMVDAKAERVSEKLAEGRITQDEADEKLAELEARITDRANGVDADADADADA